MSDRQSKTSPWKAILAALSVIGTVVGIVAAVHELTTVETPSPPGSTNINVAAADTTPVYASAIVFSDGSPVYVYDQPYLTSAARSYYQGGQQVELDCTMQGDAVTNGVTPPSSLWYRVGDGFVPDAHLVTGTDQAQKPPCA